MLRAAFLRAVAARSRAYRVISLASASVALLGMTAQAGTPVSFDRQANGQQMSDTYLDGNNQQQTYTWTWNDNANWSQSRVDSTDPAGNPIELQPSNWSQDTAPNGDYDVSLGGAQITDDISVNVDTLSLSGELDILGGQTLNITNGSLVNNGTISIDWDDAGLGTALNFSADASISGKGTIVLNNDNAQLNTDSGATVTIGADQTINGDGQISGAFINNGAITSTVAAGSISITGTLTNNNSLNALNGSTLSFNGTMTNNGSIGSEGSNTNSNLVLSGTINNGSAGEIDVGSNLYLESATINGGRVLATFADAYIQVSGNSVVNNADFELGGQDKMDILGGTTMTFGGTTTVQNYGTITVNSDNSGLGTALNFSSDISITGEGDILLTQSGAGSQFNADSGVTVTLGAQQTLHGTGDVNAAIINKGTISADVSGASLDLSSYGIENDNVMQALNGSTMNIDSITITNTNGQITASDVSSIVLTSATIDGGQVNTFTNSYVNWNNCTMTGSIELSGVQNIVAGSTTTMTGTALANNGQIVVNPDQELLGTSLSFDADTDLTGNGEILLNAPISGAQINVSDTHVLTVESGQIIDGQGEINGNVLNKGRITANVAGQTLALTSPLGIGNQGTLSAINGATLELSNTITNYASISADASSTLALNEATVTNQSPGSMTIAGQLSMLQSTIDGGSVDLSAAGASGVVSSEATIENTTFTLGNGNHFDIQGGSTLIFDGTMNITNNGTITVDSDLASLGTALNINADMTIGGSGDILLANGASASQFNTTNSSTVTLGASQTLHGSGAINAAMIDQGTISADTVGGAISLSSYDVENDHIMQASNQSTLDINSITVTNTSGQINASNQSAVLISSATIIGGTVSASANSHVDWSNSTMSGALTLSGLQNIPSGNTITANGPTLTNNGKIIINSDVGGLGTALDIDSDLTLNGSGQILLNLAGTGAQLNVINSHTLTVGANQLIDGQGTISGNIINQGTIRADVKGQTLEIGNAITNSGKLDVAGGTLLLDAGLTGASVRAQLFSGSNGGAWNGSGIISSLAPSHKGTAVGYTSSNSTYTLMYTWLGDTDLNGVVNNTDLLAISPAGTTWSTGDFNYDGKANQDDYALFMLGAAESNGRNISLAVPEPGVTCALGGLALSGLLKRKKQPARRLCYTRLLFCCKAKNLC
ncbi:MAG TPA: hypothetical protein VGG19_20100 [Tepidisphaeraceae bacterium]